jgi:magnesium transporter
MPDSDVILAQSLRRALRVPAGGGGDLAFTLALHGVHAADISLALRSLTKPEALAVFNWLDNDRAATVLGELDSETTRYILANAPPTRIADLLDQLPVDDAAWVVSEASPERATLLMEQLHDRAPEDARAVGELLTYPEGSAGRLMTDKFIRLLPEMTVAQAFASVRRSNSEVETLTELYVVAPDAAVGESLMGVLSLRDLVQARDEETINNLMETRIIQVTVDTDQEELARIFAKYAFMAVPVMGRDGFLAGIVTIDDILDVLTQESTEDQLRFAGVSLEPGGVNLPYFSAPLWRVVRSRAGWLVLLFVAETATGLVLRHFQAELATVVALSFFIPLLIGTGGNTGAQTVSTIIRGLALDEIRLSDTWRVLLREMLGGALLGAVLGVIGFARAMTWGSGLSLSLVVGITLLLICTWANTIGSLIPLLAQRFKVDPALVSAPLITTLVDATGLAIYLMVAKVLIRQLH